MLTTQRIWVLIKKFDFVLLFTDIDAFNKMDVCARCVWLSERLFGFLCGENDFTLNQLTLTPTDISITLTKIAFFFSHFRKPVQMDIFTCMRETSKFVEFSDEQLPRALWDGDWLFLFYLPHKSKPSLSSFNKTPPSEK